jgi:Na(+)-translocating NADH:ubiquinone oxidoreductase C subunit
MKKTRTAAVLVAFVLLVGAVATIVQIRTAQHKKFLRQVHLLKVVELLPSAVQEKLQKDPVLQSLKPGGFKREGTRIQRTERYLKAQSCDELRKTIAASLTVLEIETRAPSAVDAVQVHAGAKCLENLLGKASTGKLYVFKYKRTDGNAVYAIEIGGPGYWGKISGYLALEEGLQNVAGISFFDHRESTGLGKRVEEGWFQAQFTHWHKRVLPENGEKPGIRVTPRLGSFDGDANPKLKAANEVDAITAATETSQALDRFITANLQDFFKTMAAATSHPQLQNFLDGKSLEFLKKLRYP